MLQKLSVVWGGLFVQNRIKRPILSVQIFIDSGTCKLYICHKPMIKLKQYSNIFLLITPIVGHILTYHLIKKRCFILYFIV